MKVEIAEYIVTFEEGKKYTISLCGDDYFRVFDFDAGEYEMGHIFSDEIRHETMEEALEALKKWKESQE